MKRFLAVYTGSPAAMASWSSMPEDQLRDRQAAGIKAWHDWVEKHKDSILEPGAPLGATKRASSTGISDTRNDMTAFTIVQAESHEAAATLFEDHPHFTIFPGEAIDVMECLPIPGG